MTNNNHNYLHRVILTSKWFHHPDIPQNFRRQELNRFTMIFRTVQWFTKTVIKIEYLVTHLVRWVEACKTLGILHYEVWSIVLTYATSNNLANRLGSNPSCRGRPSPLCFPFIRNWQSTIVKSIIFSDDDIPRFTVMVEPCPDSVVCFSGNTCFEGVARREGSHWPSWHNFLVYVLVFSVFILMY